MKTKFIKIITIIFATLTLMFSSATAFADSNCSEKVCTGSYPDSVKIACGCKSSSSKDELPGVIVKIINAITAALGIVALIFIFIGGVQYMTSSGDAGKTKKAKDTILYACIGLVVCVLAFAITQFVINAINK